MGDLKLNLGRFDQCVSYLEKGQHACYPISEGQEVFYYMSHDGDIVSTKLAKDDITIPTFDIGAAVDHGCVDDSCALKSMFVDIELEIFAMIKRILKEHGNDCKLKNILIPIRNVQVFNDDRTKGSYGWAEIGIALCK